MKAFAIRDAAISKRRDLAYLLYYERSRRFMIELCDDADTWDLPPILSSFQKRGDKTLDFYWSRIWVEQRIVPTDRQNLGMILREHGLSEYDPYSLLMIANGRCAQDDCFLSPLEEDQYPPMLQERLTQKVSDLLSLSGDRCLVFFDNGAIRELQRPVLEAKDAQLRRLLLYYNGLRHLRRSPGGQGIEWSEEQFIPAAKIRECARPYEMTEKDIHDYIRTNLMSTGEAAQYLGCSRQNVNDLVKRGKLKPIREEKNNSLFLRKDILSKTMD